MIDRSTPETDAHQSDCLRSGGRSCGDGRNAYWLSRRLERERDEARDAAEKAKAFKRVMKDENAKLRRDLDKAQRDVDTFLENLGKTQERAINAERKLDELNKRLAEASSLGVDLLIQREQFRREFVAERAIADRLADSLTACERWVNQSCDVKTAANKALIEWKEARNGPKR